MVADKEVQLYFKSYYHQSEAMDIYLKDRLNLRIFSYENPTSKCQGSRKYITTELSKFVKWYLNTKEEIRNFYEIIPIDTPCRLYFDLEYSKEQNPEVNSREVFDKFCLTVKDLLKSEYDIEVNIDESFLILESSTPTKFSLHVIIHLPGRKLFLSNVEMKKFTDFLYITMLEKNIALVNNGKINNIGEKIKVPIFDPAVYTKNRNFRLYLSCKLGKNTYLRLSDWCKFYKCKNVTNPVDVQIFFDSLCVPRFYDKCETLPEYIVDEEIVKEKIPRAKATNGAFLYNACKINNDYCEYVKSGYGRTSPFVLLEKFIVDKNKERVMTADIRAWDIIKIKETGKMKIIFHIKDCRYCFQIQREHKSNHIYWEIYFDPNLICHQKCYDRECCGRASIGFQVPSEVAQDVVDALKRMDMYQVPFDSFVDSFWNMERDNVTIIGDDKTMNVLKNDELEESGKAARKNSDPFISPESKIPKLFDNNKEISITSSDKQMFDPVVVDGRIPTQKETSFEFMSFDQKFSSSDIVCPQPTSNGVCNEEEDFMTDDEYDGKLSNISSFTLAETDPLNDCFINSTFSSINESLILNTTSNPPSRLRGNQRNICISDKSGAIQTILESSYDTANDDTSNKTPRRSSLSPELTNIATREYLYRSPKTLHEANFISKKCSSSDKCKTPFKSPIANREKKTTSSGSGTSRESFRFPLIRSPRRS